MKRPIDVIVMSIVDVDDPCNIEVPIEERLSVELLAAVIMNFIEVWIEGYDETIHAL